MNGPGWRFSGGQHYLLFHHVVIPSYITFWFKGCKPALEVLATHVFAPPSRPKQQQTTNESKVDSMSKQPSNGPVSVYMFVRTQKICIWLGPNKMSAARPPRPQMDRKGGPVR